MFAFFCLVVFLGLVQACGALSQRSKRRSKKRLTSDIPLVTGDSVTRWTRCGDISSFRKTVQNRYKVKMNVAYELSWN